MTTFYSLCRLARDIIIVGTGLVVASAWSALAHLFQWPAEFLFWLSEKALDIAADHAMSQWRHK